jgi:hypothetical protein
MKLVAGTRQVVVPGFIGLEVLAILRAGKLELRSVAPEKRPMQPQGRAGHGAERGLRDGNGTRHSSASLHYREGQIAAAQQ